MSPEQGDVETIRDAIRALTPFGSVAEVADAYEQRALAALDRLAAALERAERERDEWRIEADRGKWPKEKAQEFFQWRARAEKAERVLAEIARLSPFVSPEDDNSIRKAPAIARSALRPSEDNQR